MPNKGIAPLDPASAIGGLRNAIGDTEYIPLVPAVEGYGDYAQFSDDQLAGFLVQGADSLDRAIGYALRQLATVYAIEAVSVGSADMRLDLSKRSTELRLLSVEAFKRADDDDAIAALADSFFTFIPGPSTGRYFR